MPHADCDHIRHSDGFRLIATIVESGCGPYGGEVRLFVVDGSSDEWNELTSGDRPPVRLAAPDLLRAQRSAARIRSDESDVAVILDVRVTVTSDVHAAQASLATGDGSTVRYVGTVDGLTGLIADIELADVADGVTLIPDVPRQDLRGVGTGRVKPAGAERSRVGVAGPIAC